MRVNAEVLSYIELTITAASGAQIESRGRDMLLRFGTVDAFGLSRSNQFVAVHPLSDRSGALYAVPLKITAGLSAVGSKRGQLSVKRKGAGGPDAVPRHGLVLGNFRGTYRTQRDFEILHPQASVSVARDLGAGNHVFTRDVGLFVRPRDTAGRRSGRIMFTLMVQ